MSSWNIKILATYPQNQTQQELVLCYESLNILINRFFEIIVHPVGHLESRRRNS